MKDKSVFDSNSRWVKKYSFKEELKYWLIWGWVMKLRAVWHFLSGEHKKCGLDSVECWDIYESEADIKAGRIWELISVWEMKYDNNSGT